VNNIENIAKQQHELLTKLESVELVLRDVLNMKNNIIAQYNRHVSETHNAVDSDSTISPVPDFNGGSVAVESEVQHLDDDGASLHASGAFYKQFLTA
jgi:hypothetical protein